MNKDLTQRLFQQIIMVDNVVKSLGSRLEKQYECHCIHCGESGLVSEHDLFRGSKAILEHQKQCQPFKERRAKNRIYMARVGKKFSEVPEWKVWKNAIERCHHASNPNFEMNREDGIRVFEPWLTDFLGFMAYVGEKPRPESVLVRIQSNRGYEPGNVRWGVVEEIRRNSRKSLINVFEARRIRQLAAQGVEAEVIHEMLYLAGSVSNVQAVIDGKTFKGL